MTRAPEDRWRDLWTRLGAAGDPEAVLSDLRSRYSEPHRAYHTLAHIRHCLEEFEPLRAQAAAPDAIELAIWYHDAIYDPRAADNEERSAELFARTAGSAGLAGPLIETTRTLILATRHRAVPADADARLFVDIDLAILGQPWDRFQQYEEEIRREYSWVPSLIFRMKRGQILRGFLDRPTIYGTPAFRDRYEASARENLRRSLAG